MSFFRKAAARILFRASGELTKLGIKLVDSLPDDETEEDDDEDVDVPPQNPMTPEARAMIVNPPTPKLDSKPEVEVLEGSARARYLERKRQRGL